MVSYGVERTLSLAEKGTRMIPLHLRSTHTGYCARRFCVERVKVDVLTLRWFITMNHAGFNNPANNSQGYASRSAAMRASLKRAGLSK